jgi:hypothetical protein
MTRILTFVGLIIVLTSCSHSYYVVRHAEKATQETNMTSDVPLTEAGKQRAMQIKDILKVKRSAIFFRQTQSGQSPLPSQLPIISGCKSPPMVPALIPPLYRF